MHKGELEKGGGKEVGLLNPTLPCNIVKKKDLDSNWQFSQRSGPQQEEIGKHHKPKPGNQEVRDFTGESERSLASDGSREKRKLHKRLGRPVVLILPFVQGGRK